MTLLVNNAAGVAANNDDANDLPYVNPDPVFVARNLLTTVYAWAQTWGGAQIQLYMSPNRPNAPYPATWFPVGAPITANGFVTFQHRWAQLKAVVTNASASTAGLYCSNFDGL